MPVMVMFRKPLLNRRITRPDPTSALPPTGDDWSFTWHEQGSPFGLRPFPAFAKTVRPAYYRQDCHTWSPPLRQGYTKSVSPNNSPCQNPSRLCKSMSMGRGSNDRDRIKRQPALSRQGYNFYQCNAETTPQTRLFKKYLKGCWDSSEFMTKYQIGRVSALKVCGFVGETYFAL